MDLASSKDLAKSVAGIDVIVQGKHYVFEAGDPDDPYPLVLSGAYTADGNPTYIVAGGHFGDRLGRLEVTFNADASRDTTPRRPIHTGENCRSISILYPFYGNLTLTFVLAVLARRMELTLGSKSNLYIPDQGVYKYDTASDTFNTWDKVVAEYNNVETFKGTFEGQTSQEVRMGKN